MTGTLRDQHDQRDDGGKPGARGRPRARRLVLAALALAGVCVVAFALGFVAFVAALPDKVAEPGRRTDAIVVLTGGTGRVSQGLSLLERGSADKLFVSGVYKGVDVAELLRVSERAPRWLACCVALGYEAETTYGNAVESARWVQSNGFGSLRLVTAAYHMPRSLLEFRRQMPDVKIVPHPVFPEHVKHEDWWRWPGSTHLLIGEYSKYLVARARALLTGPARHAAAGASS